MRPPDGVNIKLEWNADGDADDGQNNKSKIICNTFFYWYRTTTVVKSKTRSSLTRANIHTRCTTIIIIIIIAWASKFCLSFVGIALTTLRDSKTLTRRAFAICSLPRERWFQLISFSIFQHNSISRAAAFPHLSVFRGVYSVSLSTARAHRIHFYLFFLSHSFLVVCALVFEWFVSFFAKEKNAYAFAFSWKLKYRATVITSVLWLLSNALNCGAQ